jgi:uncharacterized membrane protein YraQ (UPF0718 family)
LFTIGLNALAGILLLISLLKNRRKTVAALEKAWKSLNSVLPIFLSIIVFLGIMLAVLSPQVISKLIGQQSGALGITIAAAMGSITLIPGVVTFPLAAALLKSGAGFTEIVVFISTSMMVGVVTLPVEIKYFRRRASIVRNALALIFSFVVAAILGRIIR